MGEELGVKCSNCGNNGHDSGTCSERVALKLFGFKIFQEKREEESMKKSFSVENLQASVAEHGAIERGYLSDGPLRSRRDRTGRKKGVPWTEEEHRTFLLGLKKLGKGDWRGISRNFVTTRTPTQVASHAQKYFLRQTTNNKKKRRSSLFDMPVEDPNIHSSQSASLMAAPRLEVPQAKTVATDSSGTNAHHGMPCRERLNPEWRLRPSEAKLFPAMPFGNAAVFAHKSYKNFIVSHSPVNAVRNQSFPPSCATKMEAGSSSTTKTELELTIAPPEVHDRTKLLNGASKMGGVIRVI